MPDAGLMIPASSAVAVDRSPQPMVLVDGVPDPRLAVTRLSISSPMGVAEATVQGPLVVDDSLRRGWLAGEVILALPTRLADGSTCWRVLAYGRLRAATTHVVDRQQSQVFTLVDPWARALDVGAASQGQLDAQPTLGDALNVIDETLHVDLAMVPHQTLASRLPAALATRWDAGVWLRGLAEAYGLHVRRLLGFQDGRVVEHRSLRLNRDGAWSSVRWPDQTIGGGDVMRVKQAVQTPRAERWVARCRGALVESTFTLQAGWDASLEGQPDESYDRGLSTDFARYANVYRRWVLNEDGQAPGDVFDLTAFFNSSVYLPPTGLRWGDTVTLDGDGQPLRPIVELSTDEGASWTEHTGSVRLMADRAGLVLGDAALPSSFLAAANMGEARVRVTASLRSPQPKEVSRWRGNPFAGAHDTRNEQLGDAFVVRRVHEDSQFFDEVSAGTRASREADDTLALHAWLGWRLQETGGSGSAAVDLRLSGTHVGLKPGDRILQASGAGRDLFGRASAVSERTAGVSQVVMNWPTAGQSGPATELMLTD